MNFLLLKNVLTKQKVYLAILWAYEPKMGAFKLAQVSIQKLEHQLLLEHHRYHTVDLGPWSIKEDVTTAATSLRWI
jgi:hypothetical protein